VTRAPQSWFWSHDIEADQIDAIATPGMQLQRLSSYRRGADHGRRFAGLVYGGGTSQWLVDADAGTAAAQGNQAVSITADIDPLTREVRFTLVLDLVPHPSRVLHVGLDIASLSELFDSGVAVVDLATYVEAGVRRFAAIVEPGDGSTVLFPAMSVRELRGTLPSIGAAPLRVRPYVTEDGWRLAVLAERDSAVDWRVYTELTADEVARQLQRHRAYPVDLDAVGAVDGVRFAVIAVR
jgi:hypothetical protein